MLNQTLDSILEGLMKRYRERVPDVQAIVDCLIENRFIQKSSDIENDHIAFRTLGVPHLGIASLEQVFLHLGYQRQDSYSFPEKKLNAFWYSPPSHQYPRIFISELRIEDVSPQAQSIIHKYTNEVVVDPIHSLDLDDGLAVDRFLHRPLWRTPPWHDYQVLSRESEYAAWVIYNRYYLNHFTVSVHNLPPSVSTIEQFNKFLESNGFILNDSGGKAKISRDGFLIQSSTVAKMVDADFLDDQGRTVQKRIPGSYVEFAERRILPEFQHLQSAQIMREHRREGFEAANADRIFESTYSKQTMRVDQLKESL